MTQQWTYLLLLKSELHAEMRVFLLVNSQQLSMVSFFGRRSGKLLSMSFLVEADEKVARQMEALLYRLQPIQRVDCFKCSGELPVVSGEWRACFDVPLRTNLGTITLISNHSVHSGFLAWGAQVRRNPRLVLHSSHIGGWQVGKPG